MRRTIKRWISLVLAALLVFSAAAGTAETAEGEAPARVKRTTNIQKAVKEGGDKALWELVNTHYGTNRYLEEGCAELYIWQPEGPVHPVQNTSQNHMLNFFTVVLQETAGVGFVLEQILTYDILTNGKCLMTDSTESILPNGPVRIPPCQNLSYCCNGPAVDNARYEIIAAAGTDDNGHELEFYGVMQMLNVLPESGTGWYPENPDYDTENLRYEAEYEIQVGKGVWWVPVRSLGGSRYTNREIAGMVNHDPEQKQEEISTLYEAVQLFQISGFSYTEDNVLFTENDIDWEHHKPGYDAVRTNTGCCAASAGWLNYILSGDYEQTGFLGWSWPDGNGHVFNYIFHDGWYYFIDLTHYEAGIMTTETVDMGSYKYADRPAGSLHKAKDPETFIQFYLGSMGGRPPAVFELYQTENVIPTSSMEADGQITMYFPEGSNIRIIDGVNPEALNIQFVPGPEEMYEWADLKSAKIQVNRRYLITADEAGAEPLSTYQPGDRLTLEDKSAKGTAVIDGIRYSTSKRDEVRLGFEDYLHLNGKHSNCVFSLRLPLGEHGEALEKMSSLVLGELTLSIKKSVPEVQVVICAREDDHLVVQEIMDGKYYDTRKISIRKDDSGNWKETPDYWYLIITRDNKIKYEFGRFCCGISDES